MTAHVPPAMVRVDTGHDAYDIHIGPGLLARAGDVLAQVLPGRRACIVTDENVARLYLPTLTAALEAAGFTLAPAVILPAGEETKSWPHLQRIAETALAARLDRTSALIALGGGVVGDIAGFAASMVMRGIPFVQVPTTLLAQVDSSVGGKTGINTAQGKNLLGAFYQPRAVLIDTDTFATLPARERRAGYAEIVKYALIGDAAFFSWLEGNGQKLLSGDAQVLQHAIGVSCRAKAAVVAADEYETKDIRALLNLGHTFGHALEALGGYDGRLLHGEAVSIGLVWAARFSAQAGLCPPEVADRLVAHLQAAGMPLSPPFAVDAAAVLEKMKADKKATASRMALILLRGIGAAFVARSVSEEDAYKFLQTVCKAEMPAAEQRQG